PRLSVEEAAERSSFPVWAVAELPEGQWRVDAHYHPALRDTKEQLTLLYSRVDGRRQLLLVERAAGTEHPWARMHGAAHVEVERGGTHVTLQSEQFDEEELQALADALVRV